MRRVTFQRLKALEYLLTHHVLICDETYDADLDRYGHVYRWVVGKMKESIPAAPSAAYPLWCWVKCYYVPQEEREDPYLTFR